ncbi:MAG: hypothetical protein U0556_14180 [Dehalococcoidia bacterium]
MKLRAIGPPVRQGSRTVDRAAETRWTWRFAALKGATMEEFNRFVWKLLRAVFAFFAVVLFARAVGVVVLLVLTGGSGIVDISLEALGRAIVTVVGVTCAILLGRQLGHRITVWFVLISLFFWHFQTAYLAFRGRVAAPPRHNALAPTSPPLPPDAPPS